ncbi:MAG: hypothetical protein U1E51_16870 [Candidatus Binatia bacterium]|nr:hypothetical protein [Candidatus Binatia bacterium]
MTKKAKSAKIVKASRKPRAVKSVEVPATVTAAAKKEMAREDISNCQAIRNVAKKFAKIERKVLIAVFVGNFKMNAGTVSRQIQEGRA